MRGDARNVSVHEIDAFIQVLGKVRIYVGDDINIEDLITNTKDRDLEHIISTILGRRAVGGNSVQNQMKVTMSHLLPELVSLEQGITWLRNTYSYLFGKVSAAYANEFNNTEKGYCAELNHVAFRATVQDVLKQREDARKKEELQSAYLRGQQNVEELARQMAQQMFVQFQQSQQPQQFQQPQRLPQMTADANNGDTDMNTS
jgi:hypothetical protein